MRLRRLAAAQEEAGDFAADAQAGGNGGVEVMRCGDGKIFVFDKTGAV